MFDFEVMEAKASFSVDLDVSQLDSAATAAEVEQAFAVVLQHEARLLVLAAHWADLHTPESARGSFVNGVVRVCRLGGEGTPDVGEFAAAELAALQRTTTGGASAQMADALDLRHRLPRLWSRVLAGEVRGWQARKVAFATRQLHPAAAAAVDAAVARVIGTVPYGRFTRILQAKIIEADPEAAEQRQRLWEAERFVRAGGSSEGGLRTLVARATAGEVVWFLAMVNRIAEILHVEGDLDSADVRRSKAIGILAQPALALQMLVAHAGDADAATVGDAESDAAAVSDVNGDCASTSDPNAGADTEDGPSALPPTDPSTASEREHTSLGLNTPLAEALRTLSPARLRPRAVLHVHLRRESLAESATGVARVEGVGPVSIDAVRRFLGLTCLVRVQPVLDPAVQPSVDEYEIPTQLRDALSLRSETEVFPWGTQPSRSADLDHTIPYVPLGEGGAALQTGMHNLGPLSRSHHRAKTHGDWELRQPEPGRFVWRSPTGRHYVVDPAGTHPLGSGPFAREVWRVAKDLRPRPADPGLELVRSRLRIVLDWPPPRNAERMRT